MAATTTTDPAATQAPRVGPRVKALREAMQLSLRDLAERSGVSAPMLSQVEREETSPTLATAARIAAGLELSLSQLLRLDEGDGVDDRPQEGPPGGWQSAARPQLRDPDPVVPGQRADVSEHVLAAAAATGGPEDPPMHEPGSRETAVVTAGAIRLVCAGIAYDLDAGDAVTFDADLPHHFENPGKEEARFVAVVSAGLRRS